MVISDIYLAVRDALNSHREECGFKKKVSFERSKKITDDVLGVLMDAIKHDPRVFIADFGTFRHVLKRQHDKKMPDGSVYTIPHRVYLEMVPSPKYWNPDVDGHEDIGYLIGDEEAPSDE